MEYPHINRYLLMRYTIAVYACKIQIHVTCKRERKISDLNYPTVSIRNRKDRYLSIVRKPLMEHTWVCFISCCCCCCCDWNESAESDWNCDFLYLLVGRGLCYEHISLVKLFRSAITIVCSINLWSESFVRIFGFCTRIELVLLLSPLLLLLLFCCRLDLRLIENFIRNFCALQYWII